jgi:hypothetical protein
MEATALLHGVDAQFFGSHKYLQAGVSRRYRELFPVRMGWYFSDCTRISPLGYSLSVSTTGRVIQLLIRDYRSGWRVATVVAIR